jgi:hypothetical protein
MTGVMVGTEKQKGAPVSPSEDPDAQAILADAVLIPEAVRGCRDRLPRYLPRFRRIEQRNNAASVLRGLLSVLQRKTCEASPSRPASTASPSGPSSAPAGGTTSRSWRISMTMPAPTWPMTRPSQFSTPAPSRSPVPTPAARGGSGAGPVGQAGELPARHLPGLRRRLCDAGPTAKYENIIILSVTRDFLQAGVAQAAAAAFDGQALAVGMLLQRRQSEAAQPREALAGAVRGAETRPPGTSYPGRGDNHPRYSTSGRSGRTACRPPPCC